LSRLKHLTLFACLVAIVLTPDAAAGASRMFIGFQDDPSFRFRENRQSNLDHAEAANASILRTQVTWALVAPTKPANGANPFDPAYESLSDVDELVRGAQRRGMEVLLTIYGTPAWANGNKRPNVRPTKMSDLTDFAQALASRYSGRFPGFPYVRFYSVWNEPNLNQFLTPQFDARGRSVGPATYARIYKAAYAGIKAGNPKATVGIGETSARGHDRPTSGTVQDSHSPGRFAELVAKTAPNLRFGAWAVHPYPFTPAQPPTARVKKPNISLRQITEFQKVVDKAFHRSSTPIWITEYSHETKPQEARGVSYSTQASYAAQALAIAKATPGVKMFIWFVLRDDPSDPWQSGLLDEAGARKPAFATFAARAGALDVRNAIIYVKAGRASPTIRVSALEFLGLSGATVRVGITYKVFFKGKLVPRGVGQPETRLGNDGWLTLSLNAFRPQAKRSYVCTIDANDANGNKIKRTLTLVSIR
jgi:cellulase (glycosyl hydrolase family 5)